MALLASCWLIVESFVVPDGFLKWFYLSVYIHPLFLVFCQLFLWLIELKKLLLFLLYPFIIAFRLCLFVLRFLFSFTKQSTVEVYYDALGTHIRNISSQDCQIVASRWNSAPCNETKEVENEAAEEYCCVENSWLNKYLYSDHYSSCTYDADVSEISSFPSSTFAGEPVDHFKSIETTNQEFMIFQETEDSESSPSHSSCDPHDMLILSQESSVSPVSSPDFNESCGSNSPSKQQLINIRSFKEDIDPFHDKYTSRMRFFNLLYHERLHGMNAILNEPLTSDQGAEASTDTARKRILRSLECDVEMIYVAQCCLLWEALIHQYHKVEALTLSDNSENIVFDHIVFIKFQELEILLVRFVEDQKWECQGPSSNFTKRRLSFQSLIQVPDATGFMFVEEENKSIKATQLLEAINNCIKAFWSYIKTDNTKMSWKYESIWRTHPPVEDPQDLQLLYNVTKTLHKKRILLKDVEGKSKCPLRRKVKGLQTEYDKRNFVFAMIDMKLVQRVLKMSLVCNSHLKWCLQKLDNLDFKDGKVFRGYISHLFPSS